MAAAAGWPGQTPTGRHGARLPVRAPKDWWYAVAQCDMDGDGPPNATFVAASDQDTVFEQDPQR
jgi:hypothetical protein